MNQIFMALILLASSVSFAGMSDQDPVIASLRSRFVSAHTPSDKELRLGRSWNCRRVWAKKNTSYSDTSTIVIEKFDGLYTRGNHVMVPTDVGMRANTSSGQYSYDFDTTRIDNNGNLLIEESFTDDLGVSYWMVFHSAIADSDSYAYAYSVCVPRKSK